MTRRAAVTDDRELYEDAPCGLLALDADEVVTSANRTLTRWLRHAPDGLVDLPFTDLLAPASAALWRAQVAPTLRLHGAVREVALDVVRRGGGALPVLVTALLLRADDGAVRGVRVTLLDARDRRAYEQALVAARVEAERHAHRVEQLSVVVSALAAAPDAQTVVRTVRSLAAQALGAQDVTVDLCPPRTAQTDVHVRPLPGGLARVRVPLPTPDGAVGVLELTAPLAEATAETDLLATFGRQVGQAVERARLHEALAASEARARRAFDAAPLGMALLEPVDGGHRVAHVNQALLDLVGTSAQDVTGFVVRSGGTTPLDRTFGALLAGSSPVREARSLPDATGRQRHVRVTTTRTTDPADGGSPLLTLHVEDVTAEAELSRLSRHDPLTGLCNRAELLRRLGRTLAACTTTGGRVAVVVVDLDAFKDVNDSLGHLAGDHLLVRTAARLADATEPGDTVARLGGDAFAVVRPLAVRDDEAAAAMAAALAARVEQALEQDVTVLGRRVRLSLCSGIAFSAPGDDAERLLRDADAAVHRAKRAGPGRSRFADRTGHERAMRQIELEAELRAAVAGEEAAGHLRLVFQPAFERAEGPGRAAAHRVRAVEALLRWDHPTRGTLAPGAFLDVAEERRLIVPIGAWVLGTACAQGAAWERELGDDAPQVWVNVSARQLHGTDLTTTVADTLRRTGLSPHLLCVELTERQLVSTSADQMSDLTALGSLGVHLALDDFGTGYAGLDYLRRMAFDVLKIDRSYVVGLGTDARQATLAAGIVAIGRSLGLTVVAEGVETQEQLAEVEGLGCDLVQGYLLGRPADAVDVSALLGRIG